MQNGRHGTVADLLDGIGFESNEFHVIPDSVGFDMLVQRGGASGSIGKSGQTPQNQCDRRCSCQQIHNRNALPRFTGSIDTKVRNFLTLPFWKNMQRVKSS
jgi:hypothetical protein